MSAMSWTLDAPSGVYKNRKLSEKIREATIPMTKFMQWVQTEPGFGKKMGESVSITRISNVAVPTSTVLTENQRIPEDEFVISTQQLTVLENGRSIPYTSLNEDLGQVNLNNQVQKELRKQLAQSLDIDAATAFKEGQVKAIPDGVASMVFDTDGTASTQATANLNMFHVEQIRDFMFTTLNIDPFVNDDYIFPIATKAKRGLMSDPAWVDWKKYTDPDAKFNSEIGRIENMRFIEINNTSALSGSLGLNSVLGEGVAFGSDPVTMATAEQPELRLKESEDYGRSKGVAWYGIYAFQQIWKESSNAGEARVVHLTSS